MVLKNTLWNKLNKHLFWNGIQPHCPLLSAVYPLFVLFWFGSGPHCVYTPPGNSSCPHVCEDPHHPLLDLAFLVSKPKVLLWWNPVTVPVFSIWHTLFGTLDVFLSWGLSWLALRAGFVLGVSCNPQHNIRWCVKMPGTCLCVSSCSSMGPLWVPQHETEHLLGQLELVQGSLF